MTRPVITTVDSILWILKDYCKSEDIPQDAVALKLMVNPAEHNKIAILAESNSWSNNTPLEINFDIRRFYGPKTSSNID